MTLSGVWWYTAALFVVEFETSTISLEFKITGHTVTWHFLLYTGTPARITALSEAYVYYTTGVQEMLGTPAFLVHLDSYVL